MYLCCDFITDNLQIFAKKEILKLKKNYSETFSAISLFLTIVPSIDFMTSSLFMKTTIVAT